MAARQVYGDALSRPPPDQGLADRQSRRDLSRLELLVHADDLVALGLAARRFWRGGS
jgi:hypothetical protein